MEMNTISSHLYTYTCAEFDETNSTAFCVHHTPLSGNESHGQRVLHVRHLQNKLKHVRVSLWVTSYGNTRRVFQMGVL